MTKLMRKSTKAVTTVAVGMISLGKYTLLISLSLPIRLLDASPSAVENRDQGSIAAKTIKAYGAAPSLGRPATRPKITVKTTIVKNGRMIAQATPMIVCLYRTAM